MKKLLALLLTVVMLFSCASVTAFALYDEVTDDFLPAVRVNYNNDKIEKNEVIIYYLKELGENKYVTKYAVSGYGYTCDMVTIEVGDYIIETSRPELVIYANGTMYGVVDAYEKGIIDDDDLDYMCTCDEIQIHKPKLTKELRHVRYDSSPDDLVYVRFELEGSEKYVDDYENWTDDISGAFDKLYAYYETLHQRLLAEVLKDFDYIDCTHNNGISVIGIRCGDLYEVASNDFVVEMDYITEIHARYLETYNPDLKTHTFEEIYSVADDNLSHSYVILKAHGNWSRPAAVGFKLGDVVVQSGSMYGPFTYQYGIYDITEDKFYDVHDLKETYDKYYMLEDNLIKYAGARPVGDSDGDKLITVLDATKIQRVVAELEYSYYDDYYVDHKDGGGYVSDIDNDGAVTVMDATAIQMLLVENAG